MKYNYIVTNDDDNECNNYTIQAEYARDAKLKLITKLLDDYANEDIIDDVLTSLNDLLQISIYTSPINTEL